MIVRPIGECIFRSLGHLVAIKAANETKTPVPARQIRG